MYKIGEIIDCRYIVQNICSNSGGMGTILFVEDMNQKYPFQIVLKYCKNTNPNAMNSFIRETRYMTDFTGNTKVAQIVENNLEHIPPYFVMKFYKQGDLSKVMSEIQTDIAFQEQIFFQAIDAIQELHNKGFQHRDIKPQNFLFDGEKVVVSDLGLAKEIGAGTTFTMSNEAWGTESYSPPEYRIGGFKESSPSSDIFMLGKTFYNLLTDRDPVYLMNDNIHPAIYQIILRCCEISKDNRYQTLNDLKQDFKLAYDVILQRADGYGEANQKLSAIINSINTQKTYDPETVQSFLSLISKIPQEEKSPLFYNIPMLFFVLIAQPEFSSYTMHFLNDYEKFALYAVGTWSYAETVADNMKVLFDKSLNLSLKIKALEVAISCAIEANRFAAMETCSKIIRDISDNNLGSAVAVMLSKFSKYFITEIEVSECNCDSIRNKLKSLQNC